MTRSAENKVRQAGKPAPHNPLYTLPSALVYARKLQWPRLLYNGAHLRALRARRGVGGPKQWFGTYHGSIRAHKALPR